MRISDWSSDVCSSDLEHALPQDVALDLVGAAGDAQAGDGDERSGPRVGAPLAGVGGHPRPEDAAGGAHRLGEHLVPQQLQYRHLGSGLAVGRIDEAVGGPYEGAGEGVGAGDRSEAHTSELQSLMRISYAVLCLNKTNPSHT